MYRKYYRKAIFRVSHLNIRLITSYIFISGFVLVVVCLSQGNPAASFSAPQLRTTSKPAPVEPVIFRDVTLDWNVNVLHQQSSNYLTTITESLGGGICVIDINNDGWMDLFFVGGSGHTRPYGKVSWWSKASGNRLLLNKHGRRFEDVTGTSGLDNSIWGMACAVGDLNNDGLSDLIVTGVGVNQLFKNNGDLSFSDVTANSGMINDSLSTGASLADFNGDGLLDFYVSNYVRFRKGARTFERDSGFRTVINTAFDQTLYDSEPNRLYLNKGGFHFVEVAKKMGVENASGRSLGAKWFDFNNDSWLDLLVINDNGTPNQVYISQQGESFSRDVERYAGFEIAGVHDVIIEDFDNDRLKEFFMTAGMGQPPVFLSSNYQALASTNPNRFSLTIDPKQLRYIDAAWSKGLARADLLPLTGWGSAAADFNNDGFLDLYVANGAVHPDIDSHFVPQAQEDSLFINTQRGEFERQITNVGLQYPSSSRGVVSVDLDNDGLLEVVVSNNNDALQIYKNEAPINNWIGLDFSSLSQEAEIYGSTVTVITDTQKIYRTLQAPQQFLSQGDGRMHIGLGGDKEVISLSINWRNGAMSEFEALAANNYYRVDRELGTLTPKKYTVKTNTHFNESLKKYDDKVLVKLTQLLINTVNPIQNEDDLSYIWNLVSENVRAKILEQITEYWGRSSSTKAGLSYLSIVKRALADSSSFIRVRAINMLKAMELEISVRWLIPRLADENVEVQCAAAEAFGFFFNEEEAVTHRKTLALPSLINLLDSKYPKAIVCAADALAIAESRRAVIPLMTLVEEHSKADVRIAAIRALGLISDKKSINLLRKLMNNPVSTAQEIGAGLIALIRLNDLTIDKLFTQFFSGKQQGGELIRRFDTLSYLFSVTGGIVFPKEKLEDELVRLIKSHKLNKTGNAELRKNISLAKLKAIASSGSSLYESEVLSLIASPSQIIKKEAFLSLWELDNKTSREKFKILLLQQEAAFIYSVLEEIASNKKNISSSLISLLFKRKDTSQVAILFLKNLPVKDASKLLNFLLDQELNEQQYLLLLNACTSLSLEPKFIGDLFWLNIPVDLHHQAFNCFSQVKSGLKESDTDKTEFKSYVMMKKFLSNNTLSRDTNIALLIKASRGNSQMAREVLSKELAVLPDHWLLPALEALAISGEIGSAEGFLRVLYRESERSWDVRLQAALLLSNLGSGIANQKKQSSKFEKDWLINNKTGIVNYFYQNFSK